MCSMQVARTTNPQEDTMSEYDPEVVEAMERAGVEPWRPLNLDAALSIADQVDEALGLDPWTGAQE